MPLAPQDQRRFPRAQIRVPINISTQECRDRGGITRDVSASGVRFLSSTQFEVGDRLVMNIAITKGLEIGSAQGRVVRTEIDPDLHSVFPFCTAVEFDAPLFDLDDTLQTLSGNEYCGVRAAAMHVSSVTGTSEIGDR